MQNQIHNRNLKAEFAVAAKCFDISARCVQLVCAQLLTYNSWMILLPFALD